MTVGVALQCEALSEDTPELSEGAEHFLGAAVNLSCVL